MTKQRIICRWLSGAILLGSFCVSGGATVLEYTTQSSFTAATSGVTSVTFTGPGPNSTVSYSTSAGYVSGGADFIGYDNTSGSSGSYDLKNTDNLPDWGSGAYLDGPGFSGLSNNAGITVTLPTNTFAVGSNFMSPGHDGNGQPDSEAQNFQVLLSTGDSFTVTSMAGFTNMAFVGFTSTTAITSITFTPQSSNRTELDNFQFGQIAGSSDTSPTPETETALLCGGGLTLMAHLLRRRKNLLPAMA
jgi:hypothetical protein